MLIYITLYIIVMMTFVIQYSNINIVVKTKKERRINGEILTFFIIVFLLSFIEGFRNVNVGEDLKNYISAAIVYRLKTINIDTMLDFSAFEPGFMLLCKFIGIISLREQAFILITSVLIVFLNMSFLYKNSDDFYLSVLLFLGFNHFFTSMVSLRQYIAIGLVMWVLPSVKQGKYIKALIFSVIAFFFHQTSIIATVFIVLSYVLRKNKRLIPWLGVGALLIMQFANEIFTFFTRFFMKYAINYSLIDRGGNVGKLRIIYILLQGFLIIYVYFRKDFKDEEFVIYSILLIPAIACGLLTTIPWIFRIGYYFDYFMLLLIPKIVINSQEKKNFLRVFVILISTVFFLYYLSINPGQTVPYEFY